MIACAHLPQALAEDRWTIRTYGHWLVEMSLNLPVWLMSSWSLRAGTCCVNCCRRSSNPVLLSAEADAVCGAEYGTGPPEHVNRRNGYRHRDFDTRAWTVDVTIPQLRAGAYFPEWLLEPGERGEGALTVMSRQVGRAGVTTWSDVVDG